MFIMYICTKTLYSAFYEPNMNISGIQAEHRTAVTAPLPPRQERRFHSISIAVDCIIAWRKRASISFASTRTAV
jgi:hypothetical protein